MSLVVARLVLLCSISVVLAPAIVCQPSDASYQLAWSEEFEYVTGSQPSSAVWNWETGAGGWGNEELEFYTPRLDNSYANDSALVVQANWESYYGWPYTSARLNTQGKVEVYLGYVAARVRISMSNGFWPAVWMLGAASSTVGWPYCGEIDFMEQVNGMASPPNSDDHYQHGTVHYNTDGINGAQPAYTATSQGSSTNTNNPAVLWGDDWHVYAFEWTTSSITFNVDNVTYGTICTTCTTGTNAFHNASNPFFFVVDLAMGGNFPNATPTAASLPGQLVVDWIRVWQKDDGTSYVNAPGMSSSSSSASPPPSHSAASSSSSPSASVTSSSTSSSIAQPSSSSACSSTTSTAPSSSVSSASTPPSAPSSSSSSSSSSSATADSMSALDDWSPPDPSYMLVWHEEFSYTDGLQPSASLWNWETGNNDGWGNDELEYYTTRTVNSYVSDNTLIVAGQWESYGGFSITSARLTTDNKVLVYQGVVAARVRVRGMQNGYWPSVWMMGNKSNTLNWPFCGEIDFMEQVNGMSAPGTPSDDHYQHGSLHYNAGGESAYPTSNPLSQTSVVATPNASVLWGDDWHVYAVEWTSSTISFIVDSNTYSSFSIGGSDFDAFRDPSNPFYVLVDFAFGGMFPNIAPLQSAFPAYMEVDWVRVWQQPGGSSYVVAPASSIVAPGSSSSAGAGLSSSYYSSSYSTASSSSSSSSSSEVPLPSSTSSSGGGTVHTSGARQRVDVGVWWLCLAVLLLMVCSGGWAACW